jgi:membrane-associated PAP2 superfamily phosphatase
VHVKNLKLVMLLCGLAGLAALILPFGGGSMLKALFELDKVQGILYLAVFGLPTLMAAMAMAKPPLAPWQAGVALAGFALGVIKFRVWEMLPHIAEAGLQGILLIASIVVGAIVSVLALLRPEAA